MKRAFYIALILWGILAFHGPQLWLMYFLCFPKTGSGGLYNAVFNAFLIFAWGCVHSVLARDFAKKAMAKLVGRDFAKLLYITIAGITQCFLIYLWRPLSGTIWETQGLAWWILTAFFLASATAILFCSFMLDYMEALGVRAVIRRMQNQPSKKMPLTVRGPYAYCRHPVYFFTIPFLWVGPVMNASRLEFSILVTIYVIIGTILEDRDTAKQLGPDYELYKKNVPMLIPRLSPWRNLEE